MSCPFYGCSIFFGHGVIPVMTQHDGNRCALITDAHSPCWMEVGEQREPDWKECPRNPVFPTRPDYDTVDRLITHADHIARLYKIRGAAK